MRLKCFLLVLAATCASFSAAANSIRLGLPGYYPDAEPLAQATPQLVLDALRSDPNARIRSTKTVGVAVVEILDNSARATYIFFGAGHWASPSVMRLRRVNENGVWATRISYLCGASKKKCETLRIQISGRDTQVAIAPSSVLENPVIKSMRLPLPFGMLYRGADYWATQYGLEPSEREYDWRPDPLDRLAREVDPACNSVGVSFGPRPEYPTKESMEGIGGTAVIVMTVNRAGEVIDAVVERSSRNRNLDIAATDAVSIMRFQMQGCDKPDSFAHLRLPVNFIPEGSPWEYRTLNRFDSAAFGFAVD